MPDPAKENHNERPRILIVDDDPLTRRLLLRSLEPNYEVIECDSGAVAVQLLEGDGPGLVVLDYEMPEFNGAQVCEIVRASPNPRIAQIPIIMLTAHSNEEHEIECLRAGADDFASKPVNLAVLKARIDTHLRLHLLRQQMLGQKTELEQWRRRHEEDLEAARLTQQAILPARLPVLPGWTFASHYQPLMQIGGDIYDWVRTPGGDLLVWISDATGHGASAALLTTLSKLVFRHAAAEVHTPGAVIDYVEKEFESIFRGHSYMTAACLLLGQKDGRAVFSGAGQPPLLIARKDGAVESLRSTRPPLGLHESGGTEEIDAVLGPGEGLLLYTDGLYEVMNPAGERYTQARLAASLLPTGREAAHDWLGEILARVDGFAQGAPLPDDVAVFGAVRG